MRILFALSLAVFALPTVAAERCETAVRESPATAARFQDNGDGTVTDRVSRLMWTRCSAGQEWTAGNCAGAARSVDWAGAAAVARDVNRQGALFFSDWRVPQLRELATLVAPACAAPRVDLTVFPGTPAEFYWSASTRPGEATPARVYALSFGGEGVLAMPRSEQNHVRLVRDAR
jgi:hypothetical protein